MDFLKRELAPLIDEAWAEIEAEARRVLTNTLAGRRVVDVDGPHGLQHGAVNLGAVEVREDNAHGRVRFGLRRVQPLVEVRVPFDVNVWSLDDLARGASAPDTSPVVDAAQSLAEFEDGAIFSGFARGCMAGLDGSAERDPIPLGSDESSAIDAVVRATMALEDAGVEGPYAVVLGRDPWRRLIAGSAGSAYPASKRLRSVIEGPMIQARRLQGGYVLSQRGGDFRLTLGQDAAIGYETHDAKSARLFLTESFTFQVLTPEAFVKLAE